MILKKHKFFLPLVVFFLTFVLVATGGVFSNADDGVVDVTSFFSGYKNYIASGEYFLTPDFGAQIFYQQYSADRFSLNNGRNLIFRYWFDFSIRQSVTTGIVEPSVMNVGFKIRLSDGRNGFNVFKWIDEYEFGSNLSLPYKAYEFIFDLSGYDSYHVEHAEFILTFVNLANVDYICSFSLQGESVSLIQNTSSDVIDSITDQTDKITDSITDQTDKITDSIKDQTDKITDSIIDQTEDIQQSITDQTEDIQQSINDQTDKITESVDKVTESVDKVYDEIMKDPGSIDFLDIGSMTDDYIDDLDTSSLSDASTKLSDSYLVLAADSEAALSGIGDVVKWLFTNNNPLILFTSWGTLVIGLFSFLIILLQRK